MGFGCVSHEASNEVIDVWLVWSWFGESECGCSVSGSGGGGPSGVEGVGSVVWSVVMCEGLGEGCDADLDRCSSPQIFPLGKISFPLVHH